MDTAKEGEAQCRVGFRANGVMDNPSVTNPEHEIILLVHLWVIVRYRWHHSDFTYTTLIHGQTAYCTGGYGSWDLSLFALGAFSCPYNLSNNERLRVTHAITCIDSLVISDLSRVTVLQVLRC